MELNRLIKDIKSIKYQGANEIAIVSLKYLKETNDKIKGVLLVRLAEPCGVQMTQSAIHFISRRLDSPISDSTFEFADARYLCPQLA